MAGGAVDLTTTLGRVELPSPVVTASGTFGHGDEVAKLGDPGRLGAVTAKSLSPEPWAGKPAPRLHMTASGMLNAVGLQGPGIPAWLAHDLPALRATGARVIASIWGQTVEEFARAAELLEPARADLLALEVNVSCPNLHARSAMFAHDPDATREVIAAVVAETDAPGLRQAVAQRDRSRDDRACRGRRGSGGPHPGQHRDGSPDRRRDPAPGARRGRWRPLGSGHQAGRVARGARGDARVARRAGHRHRWCADAVSTRSRCCSRARARSRSVPRTSAIRARRTACSTSSARGARRTTSPRVRDLIGALEMT